MNITYKRVQALQHLIAQTAKAYLRVPEEICLLAASKGQSSAAITAAYKAGLRHVGENHYQEALAKINTLKELPLCWHFIGPIQSNKTKGIAAHFTWVHSVSRFEIASLLNRYRSKQAPPLQICLQINLDKEATKAGCDIEEAFSLAAKVSALERLKLRGLMAIPKPEMDEEKQYISFLRLKTLLYQLNADLNLKLDTLSMGMSDDFKAAIRAGSTLIRIGRALFGERLE